MDRISLITVATGVALLFATAIHAQPSSPPTPPAAYGAPISLEQAKAAIAAAAAEHFCGHPKSSSHFRFSLSNWHRGIASEIRFLKRDKISAAIDNGKNMVPAV